ncbi:hypothetical protein GCM10020255_104610 [Rhodococcus baikonurensis]
MHSLVTLGAGIGIEDVIDSLADLVSQVAQGMGQLSCRRLLSHTVGDGVELEVADVLVETIEQRGVALGIERFEGCFLRGFTAGREELVDSSTHSFSFGHLVDFAEAFDQTFPLDLDVAGVTELSTDPPQVGDQIVGLGEWPA